MRTIDEIYLVGNNTTSKKKEEAGAESGSPQTLKSTPGITRVSKDELELAYIHDPIIFTGINKIVQTIMAGKHTLVADDKKVLKYFTDFLDNIGHTGNNLNWNSLLTDIYKYVCMYGWVFPEKIYNKKGNRIVDLDMTDPKSIDYAKNSNDKIALDNFGVPLGYVQHLPYDVNISTRQNSIPLDLRDKISLKDHSIFIQPKYLAPIKLFTVGNGFYPIGLIEPAYQSCVSKLNIQKALTNSIWRIGFPVVLGVLGDRDHEPTPNQIKSVLQNIKTLNHTQELAVPYYYDIKFLEGKNVGILQDHLNYFIEQEVTSMGIPMPFVTGNGGDTNRSTLNNQSSMFNMTLRNIIENVIYSIRQHIFKPICDLEGFKEVPDIKWDALDSEELDKKSKRLVSYARCGIIPGNSLTKYVIEMEKLDGSDIDISENPPEGIIVKDEKANSR